MKMDVGLISRLNDYLAPISPKVPGELCRNISAAYLRFLKNGTNWAVKMWDATSKIQTGLLTGNLHSLGNYDECISVNSTSYFGGQIGGKYCLATLKTNRSNAMGKVLEQVMDEEEQIDVGLGSVMSKGLRWGFCIPSSCNASDLAAGLRDYLRDFSDVEVSVEDEDCSIAGDKYLTSDDIIVVALSVYIVILVLMSTIYDYAAYVRGIGGTLKNQVIKMTQVRTNVEAEEQSGSPAQERTSLLEQRSEEPIHHEQESWISNPAMQEQTEGLSSQEQESDSPAILELSEDSPQKSNPESPEVPSAQREHVDLEVPIEQSSHGEHKSLAALSLWSNAKYLFSLEESSQRLESIDGIKVFSLIWVVFANSCLVTYSYPAINHVVIHKYINEWMAKLILNAHLAADSFLVCTGVLITYNFLKDMKRRHVYYKPSQHMCWKMESLSWSTILRYLPLFYLHRYIRLTPALAVIVFYQFTLFNIWDSGPFWNSGSYQLKQACNQSWWATLLYVQNLRDTELICVPHSWYMMIDMQLYLIAPLVLYCFMNAHKLIAIVIGVVVAVSFVGLCYLQHFISSRASAGLIMKDLENSYMKSTDEFMQTCTRLSPWVIGMFVGYILFHHMECTTKPCVKKWMICTGWLVAAVCFPVSLFGQIPYEQPESNYQVFVASLYRSSYHTLWALGIAWIIVVCETNHGGFLKPLLSAKIFIVPRRLLYSIYLVHLPIMTYKAFTVRIPVHFNEISWVSKFFGDLMLSVLASVILALLVEVPIFKFYQAAATRCKCYLRESDAIDTETETGAVGIRAQSLDRESRDENVEDVPIIDLQAPSTQSTSRTLTEISLIASRHLSPIKELSEVSVVKPTRLVHHLSQPDLRTSVKHFKAGISSGDTITESESSTSLCEFVTPPESLVSTPKLKRVRELAGQLSSSSSSSSLFVTAPQSRASSQNSLSGDLSEENKDITTESSAQGDSKVKFQVRDNGSSEETDSSMSSIITVMESKKYSETNEGKISGSSTVPETDAEKSEVASVGDVEPEGSVHENVSVTPDDRSTNTIEVSPKSENLDNPNDIADVSRGVAVQSDSRITTVDMNKIVMTDDSSEVTSSSTTDVTKPEEQKATDEARSDKIKPGESTEPVEHITIKN